MGIPKMTEERVYHAVVSGELTIDSAGMVWRVAARRWCRWTQSTVSIACSPRRAEKATPAGYLQVRSMVNGERANALAHRLVWRHFNGPLPDGMTVNHKNGIKADNRPNNLELATHSEQIIHAMRVLGFNPVKNLRSRG
jgi:hypothetical protein